MSNCLIEAQEIARMVTEGGDPLAKTFRKATKQLEGVFIVIIVVQDLTIKVAADSNLETIYRDWGRALDGYLGKNAVVGPYPELVLSSKTLASDAAIKRRRKQEKTRESVKELAERGRIAERLKRAPQMAYSDEAYWREVAKRNTSRLDREMQYFATCWARLMQLEMSEGKELANVWQTARTEVDLYTNMASGLVVQAALLLLIKCWVHGAALKKLSEASLR
ncbi:MAG TPA: hypothetical protein VK502_04030 [Candidatus Saccharimonadales bacterium]|nr:hypothetical protein [Candidatus Saccharimonadales bacterium]